MANITASTVNARFRSRVRDLANSEIVWGTNNKPTDALASWFKGSTSGDSSYPSDSNVGYTGTTLTPTNLVTYLQAYTEIYASIRRAKIVIYRTKTGYSNNTKEEIYNQTRVANLSASYRAYVSPASTYLVERGYTVSLDNVYNYIDRLRYNYSVARENVQTLTNDVCHNSCHANGGGGRSRR